MWSLRPVGPGDTDALVALWQRALPTWPIPRHRLRAATSDGYVADEEGRLVGAIALDEAGTIKYVVVDPASRRRGLGSALHDAAIERLRPLGHAKLRLGFGARPYVWPGIPRDLPDAERFFVRRGWTLKHISADLTQDLSSYIRPAGAVEHASSAGLTFTLCDPKDAATVLAHETHEHPNWVPFFREALASDPRNVLFARDKDGHVVASLLMEMPPRYTCRWSTMLGDASAEIGCVGVAAGRNGEGIGTALMALATEHVRDAGMRVAYLSFTVRWSFYERLGYRVWREYQMAELPL